ncbi:MULTISPECIES: type I toxin-antitoxin system Fst family toxin [Enterococcus]|nr:MULTISPECIES: type I toxin-antitoxin system Fst family toxin [Enterococcus]MBO0424875.1 type I toxin-antitoxin system Fst family toxin [Enterococcus faecium]OTO32814.1 hypothetical protein A5870_000144 [Enterococcus sp. 2G9_DIV0600]OTO32817.1 hypothetical protein A5870_000147 [Enterococcus sp. 2G9_DIV0600]OTO36703.1 hypothetical protein A5871_001257 [Enterococcus sp. 2F9_DIV0599]QQU17127.1 type I toxin-antitoxin system Fst family toxin [Enterococcus casseliflavus]
MLQQILTLVIAPIFCGLDLEMISRWLDEKVDD